ncbi:MAG: hypothetical protein ACKO04_16810 [Actinomycetes bacterium]
MSDQPTDRREPRNSSVLCDRADVAKDIAWRVHPWLLTPADGALIVERLLELGLARWVTDDYIEVADLDADTLIDAA